MGKAILIVGGQWGDEGKGKIVDLLTEKAKMVCRYNGGNNADHTVVIKDKTFKFHLIPSGILHKGVMNVLGNGVVVDPENLINEINNLEQNGFEVTDKNLAISSCAHVITKSHIAEDIEKGKSIGTTGRGIGPCYVAKAARNGIRMMDYAKTDEIYAKRLRQYVKDTYLTVNDSIDRGQNILLEGAQATLLDIDHGTYPYVTSSNPSAGGACTGLGISPKNIDTILGVFKAYITRVGSGPFPTELGTEEDTKSENRDSGLSAEDFKKANTGNEYCQGKVLRKQGFEYGTTTKRPRRTGWFDAVAARYAVRINGLDGLVITKLDVMSGLDKVKICVAYDYEGKRLENFPLDVNILAKCKPIYKEFRGWKDDISDIKKGSFLPKEAQAYLKSLEKFSTAPIAILSVGPERNQTLILKKGIMF